MGFWKKVKNAAKAAAWPVKTAVTVLAMVAGTFSGVAASTNRVPDCIKVDERAEYKVALVRLKDGRLYAIPANAIPANMIGNAIPSNAIPANAIPANALPASAIPANAIPANILAMDLLKAEALPASAIPSNLTVNALQSGVVNLSGVFDAIPSNILNGPSVLEQGGYESPTWQLAGAGLGSDLLRPAPAAEFLGWLAQLRNQSKPSMLCQGEFIPSMETRTCYGSVDLLPSTKNRCKGESTLYVPLFVASGSYNALIIRPTQAAAASSSSGGGSGGSSGGGGSSSGGGSAGGSSGGSSGSVVSPGCSEVYEGFTVYTGGLAESSLVIFLRIEGGATYEGTNYTLNVTPGSDREFECSLVEGHRLYCAGTHPGSNPLTVTYELFSDESGCSITSGSLYLDYGAASSGQGNETGTESGGGNETGVEYGDNGCLVGDVLDGHGLCCAESDYLEEWDSCNEPTYNPEN